MAGRTTWEAEAERFWGEVRVLLRDDDATLAQAEELVEAYRSAMAEHGVPDGLIFHRGPLAAAAAARQLLDESERRG